MKMMNKIQLNRKTKIRETDRGTNTEKHFVNHGLDISPRAQNS